MTSAQVVFQCVIEACGDTDPINQNTDACCTHHLTDVILILCISNTSRAATSSVLLRRISITILVQIYTHPLPCGALGAEILQTLPTFLVSLIQYRILNENFDFYFFRRSKSRI